MSDFTGLTEALCERAMCIIRPSMYGAMDDAIVKRHQGCLVVLDPKVPREPKYKTWSLDPQDPFEELVLYQRHIGYARDWDGPYDKVARAKAYASWKTGLPAQLIQQWAPYLYEEGWTKWGGSDVGNGGLVVAFSGVEAYFDQMFAEMMLAAIKAVCLHELFKPDGVMANPDITFLGQTAATN